MNCHGCYHGCYEPLCQICLVKGHQYYGVVWVVVTEDTCILTCSEGGVGGATNRLWRSPWSEAKKGQIRAPMKFWIETHHLKGNFLSFQKIIKC